MRRTKIIKNCSSSLCTCLHHMVILRTRNKITDFLMILAWASPFKRSSTIVMPHTLTNNPDIVKDIVYASVFLVYIYSTGKTFRPRLHSSGRRFALKPYFRKTFRTQTIFQKDVSHPNHILERRFAPKSYLGKTFRTHFIIRKDILPLFIFW